MSFIHHVFRCSSLGANKILVFIIHFLNDLFLDISVPVRGFNSILLKNNMDIVPGSEVDDHSECGEIHIDDTHGEALGAKSDPSIMAQIDLDLTDGTPENNKQSSTTTAKNADFDVTPESLVSTISHHSSSNITVQQEASNLNYIFDSPSNSESLTCSSLQKISENIFSMPIATRKQSSCRQRIRKWWTRLLTVCCPCAKISST